MKSFSIVLIAFAILSVGFSQVVMIIEITGHEDKKISYEVRDDNSFFLRVVDDSAQAVENLSADLLTLKKGGKEAKILSCAPLRRTETVSQKIVLVLDNSSSMSHALDELHKSIEIFLNNLGEASEVAIVLFDENRERLKINNLRVDGSMLSLRVNDFTADHEKLLKTCKIQIAKGRLTYSTYLNDAVYLALQMQSKQPAGFQKSIVVLSDGVDTGSELALNKSLQSISKSQIKIYCIDFSGAKNGHRSLNKIVTASSGQMFRADNPDQLIEVFDEISKRMTTVYLVNYKIPVAPTGTIAFQHDTLKIDNTLVLDESPLLNYVFFDDTLATLNDKYHLYSDIPETAEFDETKINNPLDKYYHLLNIIGSRMNEFPAASITLTGCNCNRQKEQNNVELSRRRAEAVGNYLTTIWEISSDRIKIKARNLPEKPSSVRTPEGLAENQRVEITSTDESILAPVKSIIVERQYTPPVGEFRTQVQAKDGLRYWQFSALAENDTIFTSKQDEFPTEPFIWNWFANSGKKISSYSHIDFSISICDDDNCKFTSESKRIILKENFTNSVASIEEGDKIIEKYSLILFDFNSSSFGTKNSEMLEKVTKSFEAHDSSSVQVFGYCDDIGDEKYNERLSKRRAQGVFQELLKSGIPKNVANFVGYGELNPIFSNASPEGRFLNRTVQVYISYPKQEKSVQNIESTEI